jgi:hypothetical protein
MNLTLTYVEMPYAGLNWQSSLRGTSFKLPNKYADYKREHH